MIDDGGMSIQDAPMGKRGPKKQFDVSHGFRGTVEHDEIMAALAHKWGLLNTKGEPDWSAVMRKLIEDAGGQK